MREGKSDTLKIVQEEMHHGFLKKRRETLLGYTSVKIPYQKQERCNQLHYKVVVNKKWIDNIQLNTVHNCFISLNCSRAVGESMYISLL